MSESITIELLDALLSPGAAVAAGHLSPRQQAEAHFESIPALDRTKGLMVLLTASTTQLEHHHIMLALVLVRRSVMDMKDIAVLKELVPPLMLLLDNSKDGWGTMARQQVTHTVAEVVATLSLLNPSECQTVTKHILEQIAPKCSQADPIALRFLSTLCDRVPVIVKESISLTNLVAVFTTASSFAISKSLALDGVLEAIVSAGLASQATDPLLPAILQQQAPDPSSFATKLGQECLSPSLEALATFQHSDVVTRSLQHLIQAANSCPSLLLGVVCPLSQTCLGLAKNSYLDESTKLASLEILATLTNWPYIQRHVLNSAQGTSLRSALLQGVIPLCAELMVSGSEDVEGWAKEPAPLLDDGVDDNDNATSSHAEALLGDFLHHLGGGGHSLPVVLPLVESLLANQTEPRYHRVALCIFELCLYAAPISFAPHVPVALDTTLAFLSSTPNPRVQFQGLVVVGALCDVEWSAEFLMTAGSRLLQSIVPLMSSSITKVASAACMALVSLCRGKNSDEGAVEGLIIPYLKNLLHVLVTGPLSLPSTPGTGAITVQVRAMGAIACLAEAVGPTFVDHYSSIMPGLLQCVQASSSGNYETIQLRAAAVQAMTIVGRAIGEENRHIFLPDAQQLMQLILQLLQSDQAMDELLASCARIAAVLVDQYAPYIDSVMPYLFDRLRAGGDIEYEKGDEAGLEATKRGEVMEMDGSTESVTVALPGKGLTKVVLNMAKMEEKAQAARAIYEHADALGADFLPFVETAMKELIPLIAFQFSGEVRSTCAQAAAAVFNCVCLSDNVDLARDYLPVLALALCKQTEAEDTTDMDVVYAFADALSDTLYYAYRQLSDENRTIVAKVSVELGQSIVGMLMRLMVACLSRRAELVCSLLGAKGDLSGEDEKKELEDSLKKEQEVLTPLVDSVGYTLKFLNEAFVPIFDADVAPILGPYLGDSPDTRARFAALCLFDDCVEHCGYAAAKKYSAQLTDGSLLGVANDGGDGQVKQVALYGLAQVARYGSPESLVPHAQGLTDALVNIASNPKDEADNLFVIENAVSALMALVLIGRAPFAGLKFIDKPKVLGSVLSQLPLREDEDEAKICHAGFCELVENGTVTQTDVILTVVGNTLALVDAGEDLADHATMTRFAEMLLSLQQSAPGDQLQACFGRLSPEAKGCIQGIMEQYSRANVVTP